MKRRNFLKNALYTSALAGTGTGMSLTFSNALASNHINRTLVNVMLLGGADLRYLIAPVPGSAYAAAFWNARSALYGGYATYEEVWQGTASLPSLYSSPTNNAGFGFHKNAGWLKQQFEANNAAIVANVYSTKNRRHDQSQLNAHIGEPSYDRLVYDQTGWGGRLAYGIASATQGDANVVTVSHDVSVFCNGSDANNRNARVVHAPNTRSFGLSNGVATNSVLANDRILSRSLRSYYAGQRDAVKEKLSNGTYPANWPYRRFFQHEEALRGIGDRFNTQMALTPRPAELVALYTNNSGSRLVKPHFGHQCASLYDCFLAPDILGLRAAYMEYSGWDSHRNQKASLENNFNDVFGTGGGLATLMSQLASIPGATDNIVFMFSTDFGRQIKANGTNGTDHGNGNYSILVGKSINGGLTHGEMFPDREANPEHPDNIGKVIPFQKQGADILGRTSAKRILYEATNWAHPGIASSVVPGTGFEVEGGPGGAVDQALDKLFI